MPRITWLLALLWLPLRAAPALAPASVDRLSAGVELIHYRFSDVPGVTQSVHVVRIAAADMPRLRFACTDRCETVGHWEQQKFDVFVNGTFFNTYNTRGEPSCYVRLEGKERFATHPDEWRIHGGLVRAERSWTIVPKPQDGWTVLKNAPDILTAGPVVLQDGKPYAPTRNPLDTQRHARTLVGLDDKGNGYLVTVNGHVRRLGIFGMTYTESGEFMKNLGCTRALNLDGGGSTYLYARSRGVNGLVMTAGSTGLACPVSSVVGIALE